ncbi:hypothetical protein AB2475_24135 [Salmonella enterica]|nr:hypothetical protein [Salmonella enterica]MCH5482919.1 hypothetical protein [Salmonella enterica subsp. diarizonae serovar 16:z10:e,n,x,z15]MCH5493050.1 hypothetical protein [Salmonella enterica subsp. diarizonae serovar 16:z10:e,n,x,z15]MCH5503964.1 hypothetical protein [Salmonella enterica subsp. diarizonae serovar 16:z10:e,n,x,z15]MDJ7049930.1 hypothetical protein [Salmonella enterica]MDJ7339177.1 hypothetical protein [Salmonella enterica]
MNDFCSKDIFKKGTSKEIHQMITGQLPPINGGYIWNGRGLSLLLTMIEYLVYMRESKNIEINYGKIVRLMELKNIRKLLISNIPANYQEQLRNYLNKLPNGNEESAHEFIVSRFIKINEINGL